MKNPKSSTYQLSTEDIALFRAAITDTKPLKKTGKILPHKQKPKINTRSLKLATSPDQDWHDVWPETVTGETFLDYMAPGVQKNLFRQLRQGKLIPGDSLDLHGKTIAQAKQQVYRFLQQAQQQQLLCVHIIHGKSQSAQSGVPILKNSLNTWLRQYPAVLAFCSAQIKDGGTGAVYVLLRSA